MRELAEFIRRKGVDRGAQLDAGLAVGLQAVARRTLPTVAEPHRDGVALAQVAAADPDQDGVGPWPDVEAVEPVVELGAVARLDRGVVRRRGLIELRLAHVRRGAPRDLQHAGVVDAELACRVDDGQLLVRAGDERAGRRELRAAHVLGKIGRIRHRRRDLGWVGRPRLAWPSAERGATIVEPDHKGEGEGRHAMRIARLCTAVVAFSLIASASVRCQDWPTRPIRFIVPFPAGGSTDVSARIVAEFLSRDLGYQVYVENRSGANGNIGIEAAARSAPDGHTLLVGTDAVASNPHTYRMGIDVLKDLSPVVELSRQPIVLAAHPSLGVKSIAELVALARQQPGMRYATGSGVGSLQHMVVQWFAQIAGIKLEQVPYRGGAPAIIDLLAGHVTLGSLGSTPL